MRAVGVAGGAQRTNVAHEVPRYAEHNLLIFGQLRPGEFKGGYATTYCGCLAAPIGVLCLVVYRVDLLRRSV